MASLLERHLLFGVLGLRLGFVDADALASALRAGNADPLPLSPEERDLLAALTDALLGGIGEGDIGDHFPPSDPQWKGAASDRFLIHAVEMVRARGGRIENVDVTLICEQPRIKPHRAAMRDRLADLLGIPLDAVSVKATTTEGMGFPGRGEGLAAQAVVSVSVPASPVQGRATTPRKD